MIQEHFDFISDNFEMLRPGASYRIAYIVEGMHRQSVKDGPRGASAPGVLSKETHCVILTAGPNLA